MTGAEHAAGANLVAFVGAVIAGIVFLVRWAAIRNEELHELRVAAWAYLVVGAGMILTALVRGYWQLYYTALIDGQTEVADWFLDQQDLVANLVFVWGIVALLHARYTMELAFGRSWIMVTLGIAVASYLVGAVSYLPVLFGFPSRGG